MVIKAAAVMREVCSMAVVDGSVKRGRGGKKEVEVTEETLIQWARVRQGAAMTKSIPCQVD
jgi:hypothetical protein